MTSRATSGPHRHAKIGVGFVGLALWLGAPAAHAEPRRPGGLAVPRAPDELEPVLGVELHFSAAFPMFREPLCPGTAECIFGGGGGLGARLERRGSSSVVLAVGYDAWFLDSSGVYELGVMQQLSGSLRYRFSPHTLVSPFVAGAVGALIFGDTLKVATVGGALELAVGAEVELTESTSLVVGLPFRLFSTTSFTTPRDRVERAREFGINGALALQLGVLIQESPEL